MLPFLTFGIRADTSKEEISHQHLWHNAASSWGPAISPLSPWGLGTEI